MGRNEIHVWRAALTLKASQVHALAQILSPDEQARADRFQFQKDKVQYIATRGLLRVILGRYLDIEASQLLFCYNAYGKPALSNPPNDQRLRFNLSHSHGLSLYAVTRGREVGVDVERIEPDLVRTKVAEQFFSREEVKALRRLPRSLQPIGFFNCWTRKEAYIKARGEGLSLPLDQFDVSLVPGQPAALLYTHGDLEEASRWSLHDLAPGLGYAAAVAAEGHDWKIKCWQWVDG